jgi:hypothetical protein
MRPGYLRYLYQFAVLPKLKFKALRVRFESIAIA